MSDPLLKVDGLEISVGLHRVVDGVSFDIAPGEIMALVGESGSGKSLTALSIMGLLTGKVLQTGGTISLSGSPLPTRDETAMRVRRGADLAMIFQEPVASLNPLMATGAQVAESLINHRKASPRDARAAALEALRNVGIPEPEARARQLPSELSGGMCQRVMIASAMISEPRLLIADEPTTALDVTVQAQILDLMKRLRDRTKAAILLITHDLGVVASIADRVSVMYGGRIVESAPVDDLFAAPRHPYTKLLLATLPKLTDTPKEQLYSIRGQVPDLANWPEGCRFSSRCPLADDACAQVPVLAGDEHRAACWHGDRVETLT